MKDIVRSLALLAAIGLGLLPMGAFASSPQQYAVAFTPVSGIESGSPFTALMELRISDDGIINGYYHLDGEPPTTPVTGGENADHSAWLQIGGKAQLRFQGEIKDGRFVGSAFGSHNQQYTFTATPLQP